MYIVRGILLIVMKDSVLYSFSEPNFYMPAIFF